MKGQRVGLTGFFVGEEFHKLFIVTINGRRWLICVQLLKIVASFHFCCVLI